MLSLLAENGITKPALGFETADGFAIDISWPDSRIAFDVEMPDDDVDELTAAGWMVSSDPGVIMSALERKD